MGDYSKSNIRKALARLPLEAGDVVFSHSNLGFFGRCEGEQHSKDVCEMFFDAIMERIGPDGTLVVPTFTYSSPNGDVYDPDNTTSKMGLFSEWVREHQDSLRSLDPCYSVAAIGADAYWLTDEVSSNSFDRESFFGRFAGEGSKILNLNFDAGSTFVHYVERQLGVPYRFDKTFVAKFRVGKIECALDSVIWVRYLHDSLIARFEAFDQLARKARLFTAAKLGRGEIGVITAKSTYDLIAATLPERPWFLTQAEISGVIPDLTAIKAGASAR